MKLRQLRGNTKPLFNSLTLNNYHHSHIWKILDSYDAEHTKIGRNLPLDLHVRHYYVHNKTITVPDRELISDYVYSLTKHKLLLDFIAKSPVTWQSRLSAFLSDDFEAQQKNPNFPELPNNKSR